MGINLPIATDRTQGQRGNDFCLTRPGELVYPGYVCVADEQDPDAGCGCGRAFTGLRSHKATTTALIREMELTEGELATAVRTSYLAGGWLTEGEPDQDNLVAETVRIMLKIGESFPSDTVIERRLDDFNARALDLETPQVRHLHAVPRPVTPDRESDQKESQG